MQDITISPGNLDFGQNSAPSPDHKHGVFVCVSATCELLAAYKVLTMSEKQSVTITNRTSQKAKDQYAVCKCIPGELRKTRKGSGGQLFTVARWIFALECLLMTIKVLLNLNCVCCPMDKEYTFRCSSLSGELFAGNGDVDDCRGNVAALALE